MLVRHPSLFRPARRRGVTAVEAALLLSIFLMFLFGVLEYCRYLLVLHTTTNAAREGARYASVKAANPPSQWTATQGTDPDFGTRPVWEITSSDEANVPGVTQYVKDRSQTSGMISNYNVRVFPCETDDLYGTSANNYTPIIQPKAAATSWNNATFSERIAVRVTGTYRPILPSFLWMGNTADVRITALTGSEG